MITTGQFVFFTLILMRMSGFVLFNPILGRKNIPAIAKSGFIIVLSVIIYASSQETAVSTNTSIEYGILLLKEFTVGYILAFIMNLFLYIIIFAGEIIDLQMGISMSKIYDAQSNTSISITASLYNALFILLFFAQDGHLSLIQTIITSGDIVPYGSIVIPLRLSAAMLDMFSQCTVLAVKFAFPIFAIEFLAEIGVGILMKTIPQINVFVVNIQAKLFIGLLILLMFFSPMADFLQKIMVTMLEALKNCLIMLG